MLKVTTIRGESESQSNSKTIEDDSREITRSWWLSVFLVYLLITYPNLDMAPKEQVEKDSEAPPWVYGGNISLSFQQHSPKEQLLNIYKEFLKLENYKK